MAGQRPKTFQGSKGHNLQSAGCRALGRIRLGDEGEGPCVAESCRNCCKGRPPDRMAGGRGSDGVDLCRDQRALGRRNQDCPLNLEGRHGNCSHWAEGLCLLRRSRCRCTGRWNKGRRNCCHRRLVRPLVAPESFHDFLHRSHLCGQGKENI